MSKFIVIILFFTINLFASQLDSNSSADNNSTDKKVILENTLNKKPSIYNKLLSLDYLQSSLSQEIFIFSSNLDHTLEGWLKDDTNTSSKDVVKSIKREKDAYYLYSIVDFYDDFFKDETFLNTTNKSYIRIRFGAQYNTEEYISFLNDLQVNIRLPHTEEAFYFFIGDDENDEINTINKGGEDKSTSVGVKYVLNNLDILNISIFGGFKGITNPFIKARMRYPISFKYLLFRPIQYVEYSLEDEFKEETRFYFDHLLKSKKDLIRLSLTRYTETYLKGMNYSAQLSYLNTIKHSVGIEFYTNLSGRTEIESTKPANTKYNITPTTGVYNYSTGMKWKQQFFKKYLFYELQPVVEFAQQYDYNANYIFRANLELYFGDI